MGFGVYGQNPNLNRSNHWYFGPYGAGIDFSSGTPVADLAGATMQSYEGCTAMSDQAGNLLFYTDGLSVWNRLHVPMAPGGIQLDGDISSTNSAIAFPHPANPSLYYIVTCGNFEGDISWTLIDMSANGGLGEIVKWNIPLYQTTSEKLASTENCDRSNYLAYGFRAADGSFLSIQPDLNTGDLKTLAPKCPYLQRSYFLGQMKFSPNGNFFVVNGVQSSSAGFFLFNDATGDFYHVTNLPMGFNSAEFSPKSGQVFLDGVGGLVSVSINDGFIFNQTYAFIPVGSTASPQLAKNGKMYGLDANTTNTLVTINNPDNPLNFDVQTNVPVLRQYAFDLPTFPASWFAPERFRICYSGTCQNEQYNFYISGDNTPDTVLWHYGDTLSTDSIGVGVFTNHTYTQSGIYKVTARVTYGGTTDTIVKYAFAKPSTLSPGTVKDTIICKFLDSNPLHVPEDHLYACPTYSNGLAPGLLVQSTGTYFVTWDNGCSAQVTDTIHVKPCPVPEVPLEMPNIITPNADDVNDAISVDLQNITSLKIQIYNRWGEVIHKQGFTNDGSTNLVVLWDGTCWATRCTDGVYFYILDYTFLSGSNKQLKGTITVAGH